MELFQNLFSTAGFVPRALCGQWTPQLIALHRGSDFMIWAAYVAIPVVLVSFAYQRRRDIPFRMMFVLFGLFIVACGSTHLMEYVMFTTPLYRLSGVIKLVTAIASWATVIALIPVVPRAMAMRSPEELEREIALRTRELEEANLLKDELLAKSQAAHEEAEEARRLAERAYQQAEAANRSKDEFLNTLSHELRTPLNAILGWSSLLQSGKLKGDVAAQAMESIERNAKIQARLTEDLLDVSRINEGKMRLNMEPLDPAPLIEAALDSVRPAAAAKEIVLHTAVEHNSCRVAGDPTRLQQVVWNLLTNAIKFTPNKGRVEVRLSCRETHAELSVIDNGIGIEADVLPHIFERFRQADSSTTRAHGGLGLGLAIVRSIVEMHGGSVQVSSEGADRGATFTVMLPLLSVPTSDAVGETDGMEREAPHSADQSTLAPTHSSAAQLSGVRVLVVDDEADARAVVSTVLTQHGARVQSASSARTGLQLAHEWVPQILVSDIGMPDVDGYAFIEMLRRDQNPTLAALPAVALTAYAHDSDRERALAAGYDMHVTKPVDPQELVTALGQLTKANVK